MTAPKSIIEGYLTKHEVKINDNSATEYILCVSSGDTYYLKWWGNGWVIKYQESYLCKDKEFRHYKDIPSFEFSHYPDPFNGDGWQHVFNTKEEAVEFYRTKDLPTVERTAEFYHKVYDILENLGGATEKIYRDAFVYNFIEDTLMDDEWRFVGESTSFIYNGELNKVHNDYNTEIKDLINEINNLLKELEK